MFDILNSEIIDVVCNLLEIELPSYTTDYKLATPTTMAAYIIDEDILCLNPNYLIDGFEDIVTFSVIHELRHKWQKYNDFTFDTYKPSNKVDLETYNLQYQEIDANAFAVAIMDIMNDGNWNDYGIIQKLGTSELFSKRYLEIIEELSDFE